jgi:two-component system, NarL family, invasion response regulator UvrY
MRRGSRGYINKMIKILFGSDHDIVREGLKEYIINHMDLVVIDEAHNGQEVLNKASKNDYDVIILDIRMPRGSSLDIVKQLKTFNPKLNILIFAMFPEEQFAVRAFKAGVSGCLTRQSAPEELILAIRKLVSGGKFLSSSLAIDIAFDFLEDMEKPHRKMLTDREYQVMGMIAEGKRMKDIAEELSLSTQTINSYRSRILRKLNLHSNAELIRYVIENQLVH